MIPVFGFQRFFQCLVYFKGLFAWREKDPRRLNNFRLGLLAEILVRVVPKEGIKNGGRQKQTYNLGPSALFTGVNNFHQNYKQLLDDVFVISGIITVEVSVISRSRRP